MLKISCLIFCCLCLFNLAAHAEQTTADTPMRYKQELGLGVGALIGGLVAGPPGAILGAAGGAWLGDRDAGRDETLSGLEQRLLMKQAEIAHLQKTFDNLESEYTQSLRKVTMKRHLTTLEDLSQGVTLSVYFRTNEAEIGPDFLPRIRQLAGFLQDFPEIKVRLEGHADRRGTSSANQSLSQRRAEAVARVLEDAGLAGNRIYTHAWGEAQARTGAGDPEGMIFDRRVSIRLSLDSEA